ncbi:hypothetical protein BKA62DRAFT_759585 [Auriculariales sp. MPI-PUGE-AT-0066]|nr:hypothetical protein BKA62DRAFT_759585 [Auriculariales sp. MPI-PUGE-AT-0066]
MAKTVPFLLTFEPHSSALKTDSFFSHLSRLIVGRLLTVHMYSLAVKAGAVSAQSEKRLAEPTRACGRRLRFRTCTSSIMDAPENDPNRFVSGAEVAVVMARVAAKKQKVFETCALRDDVYVELAQVYSEIPKVRSVPGYLKKRRKVHRARARELDRMLDQQQLAVALEQAHLHPIRNTPVEVLGRIFEIAVRDANDVSAFTFGTSEYCDSLSENVMVVRKKIPFVLSAVCQRWRSAALHNPRVWVYISLYSTARTKYPSFGHMHDLVQLVVSRSGQIPLHLDVYVSDDWRWHPRDLSHTLRLVVQRIVTFNLLVKLLDSFVPVWQLFQYKFPALRSFSALFSKQQGSPVFTLRAPNLRRLELCAAAAIPAELQLFSDLKYLNIDYGHFKLANDPIRRLLAAAPMLEELFIYRPLVANRNMQPVDIVHSKLTTIIYQSYESDAIDWMHCLVNAPHLSHLELCGDSEGSAKDTRLALLQKLLPLDISHLIIEGIRPKDMEGFGRCISTMARLRILVVEQCELDPPGIAALLSSISPTTPGGVWPNPDLARIDMNSSSAQDTGACAQVILDFVRARTGASSGKDNLSGGGLAALECFKVPADDEGKSQNASQEQVDAIIKLASET